MSGVRSKYGKPVAVAALIFAAAGAVVLAVFRPKPAPGDRGYWYDLSEGRLYVADAALVPPQPGVGGDSDDAYPAVVIAGKAASERSVAFLTSYTDELRALRQEARDAAAKGLLPPERLGDRLWVTDNTLVRTLGDQKWRQKSSPEGLKVLGVLTQRGENGEFPRVCSPDD